MEKNYLDAHLGVAYGSMGEQSMEIKRSGERTLIIIRWKGIDSAPVQLALSACVGRGLLLPYKGECAGTGYLLVKDILLLDVFECLKENKVPPQFHYLILTDSAVRQEEVAECMERIREALATWLAPKAHLNLNNMEIFTVSAEEAGIALGPPLSPEEQARNDKHFMESMRNFLKLIPWHKRLPRYLELWSIERQIRKERRKQNKHPPRT